MRTLAVVILMLSGPSFADACPGARATVHDAPPELVGWVGHYARAFGLDARLLQALVFQESRYCPGALGPRTSSGERAVGLGQLMPATSRELGVDPHDPLANLWGATRYLRAQYDAFGDWRLALAAYNAGPGAVRRWGGIPPYVETERYVASVLELYDQLSR